MVPGQTIKRPDGSTYRLNKIGDLKSEEDLDQVSMLPVGGQHIAQVKREYNAEKFDGNWDVMKTTRGYSAMYWTPAQIVIGCSRDDAVALGFAHNNKEHKATDWVALALKLRDKRDELIGLHGAGKA